MQWNLRPAWKVAIATLAGLALTALVLAWPAIVRGASPPVITQVQVTSSKSTFFYSPALPDTGGTVYFNSLGGGAGQIITVTVTVSDDNPLAFSGGYAFGITPTTLIPSSQNGTSSTWSVAYTVQAGHGSENGIRFVITDSNNFTDTTTISFTLDDTPPVVNYTGVTLPGYDPDLDPFNEAGNWYASSNFNGGPGNDDWAFDFEFSDSQTGARSASADWDHSNNGDDQLGYNPGLIGHGVFGTGSGTSGNSVRDDVDGVVTVTVRVEDNVGNVGFDRLKLRIDNTPPTINPGGSWSESSSFLHANGSTLYFSHQMSGPQQATLGGTANDGAGSGLDVATFSSEGNLAGSPGPDNDPGSWSGIYSFSSSSSQGDGTAVATLKDHVGNTKTQTYTYVLDGTPPVITPTGWAENPDSAYLHIIGGQLFFSHQMPSGQPASVSGTAADNLDGSGLERATFSNEPNLAVSPPDAPSPASWFGAYTFASGSSQGDGLAAVTVYDRVGNTAIHNFTYTLDATPPVVTYTGVTNPGYNPDGDELDEVGNWYASANFNEGPGNDDWVFFSDFSDSQTGLRSVRADWDHSNNPNDQLNYDPGLDGDGIFGTGTGSSGSSVRDDADGVVTVTVRVEDNVGNVGFDRLKLGIDNTPPTITSGSWSESSPFLHANGSTLYFSHQMSSPQQATLGGAANDGAGSGLDVMTFSSEANLAGSPGPDNTPDNWSGVYTFSISSISAGDGTAVVTLKDHLGHTKTQAYTYILDTTPPTTPGNFRITTSPAKPGYYNTQSLGFAWNSASDSSSGLLGYYLGASNPPTVFYAPGVTAASFNTGSDGVFTFYLQAQDRVANASLTSTDPITVDTEGPHRSFITASPEEAEHRFLVEWGADDFVTWSVDFDVQYRVNGGAWVPWLSATTATSQYFGPDVPVVVENDTLYEFQVRARDYVGNQGGWSDPWSGALTQRFVFFPVIFNKLDTSIPFAVFDGFETGAFVGWKTGGVLPRSIVPHPVSPPNGVPSNAGNYAALLGSPSYGCGNQGSVPVGQAFIQAYALVPASGTPSLRFDYRVLSYDTVRSSGGEWWDRLEVQVNGVRLPDANGSGLADSNPYGDPNPGGLSCNSLYDSGWQEGAINLSAYAGQTVVLTLFNESHKDGYWNTYSYLDNIRIEP
jgi:hypothetical protein